MTFLAVQGGNLCVWRPDPDGDAAHLTLLAWLQGLGLNFLPAPVVVSNWLKGNLGESIAHCVGDGVAAATCRVLCANAVDPFSGISKTEIDLVWMTFAEEPVADIAVLQEVKTTSDEDMSIVPDLASDYDKLFGTDIKRSMASRLHAVANELQYLAHEPTLALRLREVAKADAPGRAAQVRLRPTVVHDQDLDPSARLGKVYERLVVQGWNGAAIDSWMIALDELDTRLGRLAGGT